MKNRSRQEHGIVMPLVVVIIAVVIILFGIIYLRGSSGVVRVELQSAVDKAAEAGARSLQSTKSSWDDARNAALNELLSHTAMGGGEDGSDLSLAALDVNGVGVDPEKNLEVTVQRGWWIPGDDVSTAAEVEEFHFESMEGPADGSAGWVHDRPGLARHAIANAVRVEVTRTELKAPMASALLGDGGARVTASAIAVAGPVDPVPVAPFAIPLCALLDETGDFNAYTDSPGAPGGNPDMICRGDRIFTRSDRYCGGIDDDACGIKPAFMYNTCPASRDDDAIEDGRCNPHVDGGYLNTAIQDGRTTEIGWHNSNFSSVTDHYGVVGVPCAPGDTCGILGDDALVSAAVAGGVAGNAAVIGARFSILPDGIQDPAIGNQLWTGQIDNASSASAIPADSTDIGVIESFRQDEKYTFAANISVFANNVPGLGVALGRDYASDGVVRSKRAQLKGFPAPLRQHPVPEGSSWAWCTPVSGFIGCGNPDSSDLLPTLLQPSGSAAHYDNIYNAANVISGRADDLRNELNRSGPIVTLGLQATRPPDQQRVWQVKVPVIAADGGAATMGCQGVDPSASTDPAIFPWASGSPVTDIPYTIVGFVTVHVFDLDIGLPADPATCDASDCPLLQAPIEQKWVLPDGSRVGLEVAQGMTSTLGTTEIDSIGVEISKKSGFPNNVSSSLDRSLTGPNPWWFQVNNTPAAANLVRAKVTCETNFIPSSVNDRPRTVQLVK